MKRHTFGEIEINERVIERQLVVYRDGCRVCSMCVIDRVDSCDIYNLQGCYDMDVRRAIKLLLNMMGYKSAWYIRERQDGTFTKHEAK